jgi:hypothetical protein
VKKKLAEDNVFIYLFTYLFNDPVGILYYTASNEWYIMFSEAVMAYFDVLTLYLPGGTEENNLR